MTRTVQVWVSSVRGSPDWLNPTEKQRLSRFQSSAAATDFLVGTTLARYALGAWLGVPAAEVPLDRTCERCGAPHGRPRTDGAHLSIAHADGTALVAVSDAPVGVDLEPVGRAVPIDSGAADLADWVRKEAALKLTGDGLRLSLALIEIDSGRVTRWPSEPLPDLMVHDLAVDGFMAAAATAPDAAVELRQLTDPGWAGAGQSVD
ncbi:4'-phosphopantetheinyl transferase family protein [Branchiibius cervicis]|uniref:4'-phosphopantetheinyl transferase family protein n=1 Tax=Branchiibius cervicis TaxID=908252 RepID=A0ABW2AVN4_9MICO